MNSSDTKKAKNVKKRPCKSSKATSSASQPSPVDLSGLKKGLIKSLKTGVQSGVEAAVKVGNAVLVITKRQNMYIHWGKEKEGDVSPLKRDFPFCFLSKVFN